MRRWSHNLICRLDAYYGGDWRPVWFSPILYLFIWGVVLRLWLYPGDQLRFTGIIPWEHYYDLWIGLGFGCPILAVAAWWLIRVGGRCKVFGFGVRLGADVGMFSWLLAYHLTVMANNPINETRLVSRYLVAAVMIFVLELIVRDAWAIRVNERRARMVRGLRQQ